MPLEPRTEAGPQSVGVIEVNDAMSSPMSVAIVQVRDKAGNAKTVWQAMSASLSTDNVFGYGNSPLSINIATGAITVIVSGGVAPYDFDWTVVLDAGPTFTVDSDTAQTTQFTANSVSPGDTALASAYCTVTDDAGTTAITNSASLMATNLYGL